MNKEADVIILGAGIYGLYAAHLLAQRKKNVVLIESDAAPFQRASSINQARIHNGYHYPRSYSTALKSAHYFDRFNKEFAFAVQKDFKNVYAISRSFSAVTGDQFETFCRNARIPFSKVDPRAYFAPNSVDAAFETTEYSFDAVKIRDYFLEKLSAATSVNMLMGKRVMKVDVQGNRYALALDNGDCVLAPAVLNATYASLNQVLDLFGFDRFKLKYEICEIIKCAVAAPYHDVGITVMDGPFFSLMPFGLSGSHCLSAVSFTPHLTSHESLPTFSCQTQNPKCTPQHLENCNDCPARPHSAWKYMLQLTRKYLNSSIQFNYLDSLFAIKPIPAASEVDDSRPTILRTYSQNPLFVSVLSGKINTVFDLEEIFP